MRKACIVPVLLFTVLLITSNAASAYNSANSKRAKFNFNPQGATELENLQLAKAYGLLAHMTLLILKTQAKGMICAAWKQTTAEGSTRARMILRA